MGCTNSFLYSSSSFKNLLYTEKIDKRLGPVYLIQSTTSSHGFLAKEISSVEKTIFENRTSEFRRILGTCEKLVILPISISDSINILTSEVMIQKHKKKNQYWLKMESFSKDLEDESNIKILKGKTFVDFEIWSLLYNLVFIFTALEAGLIQIDNIQIQNILICKNTFKYFPPNFYELDENAKKIENTHQQFDRVRKELLYLLTFLQLEQKFNSFVPFDEIKHGEQYITEIMKKVKERIGITLFSVINDHLFLNVMKFKKFKELRGALMNIYQSLECQYLDPEILKEYTKSNEN